MFRFRDNLGIVIILTVGLSYGLDKSEPPTSGKLNTVAGDILEEIYTARHKPLFDSLKSSETIAAVDQMRTKLIDQHKQKLRDTPNLTKNEKSVIQAKLNKLEALKTSDYLEKVNRQLKAEMGTDTISVRLNSKNQLSVAGNLMTRTLPYERGVADPKLFELLATKTGKNANIRFGHTEQGIQGQDWAAIQNAVNNAINNKLVPADLEQVHVVKPVVDPVMAETMKNAFEAEKQNLENLKRSELEDVKMKKAGAEKVRKQIHEKYSTKMEDLKGKFARISERVYHAESQLVLESYSDPGKFLDVDGYKSGIGASKPLCVHCKDHVKQHNMEYVQNSVGLDPDGVKNWGQPQMVEVEQIELNAKLKAGAADFRDGYVVVVANTKQEASAHLEKVDGKPVSNIPKEGTANAGETCSVGGNARGCLFRTDGDNPTKVREIDSEQFMKKFRNAGPAERLRLAKIAEQSGNTKIVGKATEVDAVRKIVKHEQVKKHNKQLSEAASHVKSGDYSEASLKGARISPKKIRLQMSNKLDKFATKAGKVSGTLGKFLLAKGIAQGLASGDTTSLAIIGGRVGGEMALKIGSELIATKLAAKAGAKLGVKATATAASKTFSFLAKAANPIGAVVDIGLSAWHLSSAVKRLNDPNSTKWEQNEAIADIVGETLDIAITAVTTIAVIALAPFPPLAALVAVIGFFASLFVTAAVTTYKATNHVDMLNSKIELLASERNTEFGRYMSGRETSAYITNLIETKFANNIAVNVSIGLLERNPDIIGHVFSARTMTVDGGCRLERTLCYAWFLGCWSRSYPEVLAYNCFSNGHCIDSHETCKSQVQLGTGSYTYTCECPRSEKTSFGHPVSDQVVDFREKRWVYLDRAIPDPPYNYNYEELCRPSSSHSKGYRVSKASTEFEYVCEGAIAIRRRSGSGKYMLYELGNGTDKVYISNSDTTANRFLVENGRKQFLSGAGNDTFMVSGNCKDISGILDGGRGDDTIVFGEECAPGKRLDIDMVEGVRVVGQEVRIEMIKPVFSGFFGVVQHSTALNVIERRMEVKDVENVYGRENRGDSIKAGCTTKYIAGGGGSGYSDWDNVTSITGTCSRESEKLTVVANSFTSIEKDNNRFSDALVVIPPGATNVIISGGSGQVTVYIQQGGANSLSSAQLLGNNALNLYFGGRNVLYAHNPSVLAILLEERNSNPTQIVLNEGSVLCLHKLDAEGTGRTRNGCPNRENVFELAGGSYWNTRGGNMVDTFILASNYFRGAISGGAGEDELQLKDSFQGTVRIDVKGRQVLLEEYGTSAVMSIDSIERFLGRIRKREIFMCSGGTSFVSGKGGESSASPDEIIVDKETRVNLAVLLEGHTLIKSESLQGGLLNVFLSKNKSTDTKINLLLPESLQFSMEFPFPIEKLSEASLESNRLLKIVGTISGQKHSASFDLTLPSSSSRNDEHLTNLMLNFDENPGGTSSILVPNPNANPAAQLMAFHAIYSVYNIANAIRKGSSVLPNYFRVRGGYTRWILEGGEKDDVFEVDCSFGPGNIWARGGVNDLRMVTGATNNSPQLVNIDLVIGMMTILPRLTELSEIHRVFGTEELKEKVTGACNTQFVSGGGPTDILRDEFEFAESCSKTTLDSTTNLVQIVATGYASVSLTGEGQSFLLHVSPFPSNDKLDFFLESKITSLSQKDVLLTLHPRNFVRCEHSFQRNKINLSMDFGKDKRVRFQLSPKEAATPEANLQGINVIFTAQKNFDAVLLINRQSRRVSVFLQVDRGTFNVGVVEGAPGVSNQFNLKSGQNIIAKGGRENDHFTLSAGHVTGSIDGGGGTNSLAILASGDPNSVVTVDFHQANITLKNSSVSVRIQNIQNLIGQAGKAEEVYVNCNTRVVRLSGGTLKNSDIVMARSTLNCTEDLQAVILVVANTLVENLYNGYGTFTYIVEVERNFNIKTVQSRKTNHVYRFQYELAIVISTQFNSSSNELTVNLRSNESLTIQFEESTTKVILEMGNDRSDFHADNSRILISSQIKDGTPGKFIQGVKGAYNQFSVNVGEAGMLGGIRGSDKDDSFHLHSLYSIDSIDGVSGNRNQLQLASDLSFGEEDNGLVIDLLSNTTQSAILSKTGNATLVRKLKNIQILTGRGSGFNDQAFIACDTLLVSGVQQVVVTQTECLQHQITVIEVDNTTQVTFHVPLEDSQLAPTVFRNTTFHYKFNVLRSFRVQTEFLMDIRLTTQVFHLAFTLDQLEGIHFSLEKGELIYSIAGEEYTHSVDTFLRWNDEFFSSPKFETREGFQIKVNRQGEIFFTGMISPWSTLEDDETAEKFMLLSNRLKATFILNGGEKLAQSLLYFGHAAATNVITNTDMRSLLSGGGSNSTVYVITDLQEDVKIYPGFQYSLNESTSEAIHTVDLTHVISPIRASSSNSSKYVPRFVETDEGNLEIELSDYISEFPGKVVLVGGVDYSSQIHVLLDAVAMTLDQMGSRGGRQKRSAEMEWQLTPKPLVLSEDTQVVIMSLEDFEIGQQIVYQSGKETMADNSSSSSSVSPVNSLRNGSDIVLTNLGGFSQGIGTSLQSLIILDGNGGEELDNSTKFLAESIQIVTEEQAGFNEDGNLEASVTIPVSLLELMPDAEDTQQSQGDLEDALETAEAELLENIPEVQRNFQIPMAKKVWKHHRFAVHVVTGTIIAALTLSLIWICWCIKPWKRLCFAWKYKFDMDIDMIKAKEKLRTNQVVLNSVHREVCKEQLEMLPVQQCSRADSEDEEDACSVSSDYDLHFMHHDKF